MSRIMFYRFRDKLESEARGLRAAAYFQVHTHEKALAKAAFLECIAALAQDVADEESEE